MLRSIENCQVYSAIVAHDHEAFRIIDFMRDSTNGHSAPDAGGTDIVPPHPDDLRNIMLGRPLTQHEPVGTGEFSAEAKSEREPGWSNASSDVAESDNQELQGSNFEDSETETEAEYQRPPFYSYSESEPETDRGHPDAVAALGPPAGFGRRLIAYLIDNTVIVVILSLLFPVILARPYIDLDAITAEFEQAGQQAALPTATPVLGENTDPPSSGQTASATSEPQSIGDFLTSLGLVIFVTTLYNGLLVGLLGTTIGKRILNVYVLDANGDIPGIPLAFGRALASIVSWAIFYIGYLFILRHDNRALHDLMVGTYAITLTSGEQPTRDDGEQAE